MGIAEWARRYRYLSEIEAARSGKYSIDVTPYLAWPDGPLAALDDPKVVEVVCQKSAQVAWTSGVLGNALAKWIDLDPTPILVLFPKEGAAKEYMAEKFEPMVAATPRLRDKIDLRSRRAQQKQLFKRFPGGFLKLVGSNSPSSVKSSPIPRVAIEEPDDCNLNLKGQGDSIKMAKERTKTFTRTKVIIGGTPTIDGLSAIAEEMKLSDKRVGIIPCNICGEEHVLHFDNLRCREVIDVDSVTGEVRGEPHTIYGWRSLAGTYYQCPHCGAEWDDATKRRNVKRGRWVATAPFNGVAGFYLNELYSPFPGSIMAILMDKWLTAKHALDNGDPGPMITFTNSSMGLPYSYKGNAPEAEELAAKALDYAPKTVIRGGLILSLGVDVQHDRIEFVVRAWGRGEESWLVYHGKLFGNPGQIEDAVWKDLEDVLFAQYRHERGFALRVTACSIDSSDGNTSDAVYKWVRKHQGRVKYLMAIKGSSSPDAEIFSRPRPVVDTNRANTKAARYGVSPYIVGVSRVKDLLIGEGGRVTLDGSGPARFHVYKTVGLEYFEQLLAEVKAPVRKDNGHIIKRWQKLVGKRNEALDCEVYALHASRAAKIHLMTEARWAALEGRLAQAALFDDDPVPAPAPAQVPPGENEAQETNAPLPGKREEPPPKVVAKPVVRQSQQPKRTGFSATRW